MRVNLLKEEKDSYRGGPAETRISENGGSGTENSGKAGFGSKDLDGVSSGGISPGNGISGRGTFDDRSRHPGGPAYTTKTLTLEQFAAMPPAEKERRGVVIQELMISKLSLMVF